MFIKKKKNGVLAVTSGGWNCDAVSMKSQKNVN